MPVSCLIVDDSPEFLHAASDLLQGEGIAVAGVATTGAQAVRDCGVLKPDVVLLDVELGEEDGFEIARQLAGQAGTRQPCVVLVSAYPADDYDEMIADSPAASFLSKGSLSGSALRDIFAHSRPAR